MIRNGRAAALVLGLVAALIGGALRPAHAQSRDAEPCKRVNEGLARFVVCTADPRTHKIELRWQAADGQPYRGFARLVNERKGAPIAFAMNAGMFDKNFAPIGLYIEDGRQRRGLNTRSGRGNFHMKPNGVFYLAAGKPGVAETTRYRTLNPKAELATQSGPMLVVGGKLHPRFRRASESPKFRNGIGVQRNGTVVFVISSTPVTFYAFASFFRDSLQCPDALFLDGGSASSLYAPNLGRNDGIRSIGPILAVTPR